MTQPSITVSIISHGHGDKVFHLLEDLAAHCRESVNAVVLTFNVADPEWCTRIAESIWPFRLKIIQNSQPLGYGENHNQAFRLCDSPYFCISNPDIRIHKNPFPELKITLSHSPQGCAYPLQRTATGGAKDEARELLTPLSLIRRHLLLRVCHSKGCSKNKPRRVWVNASFLLMASSTYSALGGFDERYFMYCEDVDLCLRVQLRGGHLLLAKNATVIHEKGHASWRSLRHFAWHVRSLLRLWFSSAYKNFKVSN